MCMWVCVGWGWGCICVCVYVCVCLYVCIYVHVCECVCVCGGGGVGCACLWCVCVCMCLCVCRPVCVHVCVLVCVRFGNTDKLKHYVVKNMYSWDTDMIQHGHIFHVCTTKPDSTHWKRRPKTSLGHLAVNILPGAGESFWHPQQWIILCLCL